MTIIINRIPKIEVCKKCDGWGLIADIDYIKEYSNTFASKTCPDCYGSGRQISKPIYLKIIQSENQHFS